MGRSRFRNTIQAAKGLTLARKVVLEGIPVRDETKFSGTVVELSCPFAKTSDIWSVHCLASMFLLNDVFDQRVL